MDFTLHRLTPQDAEAFRALRLEGLRIHPEAFAASWEEERERPLAWFAERLAGNVVLAGRLADATLAGMAGVMFYATPKLRHKALLWGMFVRPEARGSGLAAALVERAIEEASRAAEEMRLSVVISNQAAIRLYRRFGFRQYGIEPKALKLADRYYDEVLMARTLG